MTGFLTGAQVFRLSRQGAERAAELEAEEEARRIEQERADTAWWQATGQGSTESGLRSYLDRYPDGIFSDRAEAELALITQERDRDAWAEAQARDRVPAYRAYLDAFPDGLFAEDARAIIAARTGDGLSPSERAQAEAREAALNLSPVARSLIEQRLASVSLDPGRIDGTFDDQTRRALRRYQEARGVVPTGYVDQGTVVRLMAEVLGGRIIE